MRFLVWVVLATGCVHVNRTTLVASTAALACDWAQTRSMARRDWPDGSYDRNPILGGRPDTLHVDVYFATAAVWNALLWYALPKRWKSVPTLGVVAVQARPVMANVESTGTICGVTVDHR